MGWQRGRLIPGLRYLFVLLTLLLSTAGPAHPLLADEDAFQKDEEIVYFDGDNVIRVYDPLPATSALSLEWASPEGGWSDIALGDVTGDGDLEIIAIRPVDNGGRLTIFDPVAQDSPEDQVQMLNGIPWAILYTLDVPHPIRLVATGEFDIARNGREILYSYADDDNDHFVILRSSGQGLPGRGWEEERSFDLEGRWSAVATGNIDPAATNTNDEVGLVSFDTGEVRLLRVEPEFEQVYNNINRDNRWRAVAFGNYAPATTDGDEMGAVRDADLPLASTWVFRYNGTTMTDVLGDRISPSPTVLFFADLAGNNDDELVVLRQVRPELGPRPRLIIRDSGTLDNATLKEEQLDGDNEYKGGDGGDVDGDGKDEIVLVRNNRIRIYTDPNSANTYESIERFTNGQTVKVGDLDAAGLAQRSRLVASRSAAGATLPPGQASSGATVITLQNATKATALPLTFTLQGTDGWAHVSQDTTTTPSNVSITFSSEGIEPGTYSGQLVVNTTIANVENAPITIDLALIVASAVQATPASIDFTYFPCPNAPEVDEQEIALSASSALSYTAQIEGSPAWAAVNPTEGVLPSTVTVSVKPPLRPSDIVTTNLLVTVDLPNEPNVVNRIPIHLACPANHSLLPIISK